MVFGGMFFPLIALPLYFILRKPVLAAATSASITPVFCSNCGAEIAPTSRFCASCGKPLPKSNWKVRAWVVVGLLYVGAFVALIAIVSHTTDTSGPAQSSSSETTSSQPSHSSGQATSLPSSSSSAVESLSSNWLLAKQANRNRETMEALTDAKQRGDMEALKRILRVRSAEFVQVIDEVNSGSYSVSDKQKMLVPLEQEKDWAAGSLLALSQ